MFLEKDSHNKSQGWIEVICGSMFSGKTEELIRRLKRAKIAKLKAIYKGNLICPENGQWMEFDVK